MGSAIEWHHAPDFLFPIQPSSGQDTPTIELQPTFKFPQSAAEGPHVQQQGLSPLVNMEAGTPNKRHIRHKKSASDSFAFTNGSWLQQKPAQAHPLDYAGPEMGSGSLLFEDLFVPEDLFDQVDQKDLVVENGLPLPDNRQGGPAGIHKEPQLSGLQVSQGLPATLGISFIPQPLETVASMVDGALNGNFGISAQKLRARKLQQMQQAEALSPEVQQLRQTALQAHSTHSNLLKAAKVHHSALQSLRKQIHQQLLLQAALSKNISQLKSGKQPSPPQQPQLRPPQKQPTNRATAKAGGRAGQRQQPVSAPSNPPAFPPVSVGQSSHPMPPQFHMLPSSQPANAPSFLGPRRASQPHIPTSFPESMQPGTAMPIPVTMAQQPPPPPVFLSQMSAPAGPSMLASSPSYPQPMAPLHARRPWGTNRLEIQVPNNNLVHPINPMDRQQSKSEPIPGMFTGAHMQQQQQQSSGLPPATQSMDFSLQAGNLMSPGSWQAAQLFGDSFMGHKIDEEEALSPTAFLNLESPAPALRDSTALAAALGSEGVTDMILGQ